MVAKTALRFASADNGAVLSTSSSKSTPKDNLCNGGFATTEAPSFILFKGRPVTPANHLKITGWR
ncbi:hypothetical protein CCACVL1_14405 [Corchorus capsularis]|uniref:Uncharacterized protein n=1 Tax=Corchorus capsularis TaxID=210143 RepID=A0A1R3I734_COCAP|nr:hypothetical protein CCACVL1_14405 [Corchorus capsularis]